MRFLLDASADYRLAGYLIGLGHDVETIVRDYPIALPDRDVLAIALREQRILITNDRDFGELVVRLNTPHAGVIYFRLEKTDLATKIAGLEKVLRDHEAHLSSFIVVSERGIRVWRA